MSLGGVSKPFLLNLLTGEERLLPLTYDNSSYYDHEDISPRDVRGGSTVTVFVALAEDQGTLRVLAEYTHSDLQSSACLVSKDPKSSVSVGKRQTYSTHICAVNSHPIHTQYNTMNKSKNNIFKRLNRLWQQDFYHV